MHRGSCGGSKKAFSGGGKSLIEDKSTDPLFIKEGSQYYFYHNDHIGTPQKLTAVSGAVVWSATYSSFLKADVDPSSTIENNFRAPGQFFDEETGLHWNLWRYYDPNLGRYLRVDPIGFKGGDLNLYIYALNSPSNAVDPLGLEVIGDWIQRPTMDMDDEETFYVRFHDFKFRYKYKKIYKHQIFTYDVSIGGDLYYEIICKDTCTNEEWPISDWIFIDDLKVVNDAPFHVDIRPRKQKLVELLALIYKNREKIDKLVATAFKGLEIFNKSATEICKLSR